MLPEVAKTNGNSRSVADYGEISVENQGVWTLETLGIELEDVYLTRKNKNGDQKKVTPQVKKI